MGEGAQMVYSSQSCFTHEFDTMLQFSIQSFHFL